MTAARRRWQEIGLCGTAAAVLLWSAAVSDLPLSGFGLWRIVVALLTLVGPGAALVLLFRIQDRLLAGVAAFGTGVAVLVLAAQISLYSGSWSPIGVIRFLAAFTLVVSLSSIARHALGTVEDPAPEAHLD